MGRRSCALSTNQDRAIAKTDSAYSGILHDNPLLVTITRDRFKGYLESLVVEDSIDDTRKGTRMFTDEEIEQILSFKRPFRFYRSKDRGELKYSDVRGTLTGMTKEQFAINDFDSEQNAKAELKTANEQAREILRWRAILDKQSKVNIDIALHDKNAVLKRLLNDIPDAKKLESRVSAFASMFAEVVTEMHKEYGGHYTRGQLIRGHKITRSSQDPVTGKITYWTETVGGAGNIFVRVADKIRMKISDKKYLSESCRIILLSEHDKLESTISSFISNALKLTTDAKIKTLINQYAQSFYDINETETEKEIEEKNLKKMENDLVIWFDKHYPDALVTEYNLYDTINDFINDSESDSGNVNDLKEKLEKLNDKKKEITSLTNKIADLTKNQKQWYSRLTTGEKNLKDAVETFKAKIDDINFAIKSNTLNKRHIDYQKAELQTMLKNFAGLAIMGRVAIREREGIALSLYKEGSVKEKYQQETHDPTRKIRKQIKKELDDLQKEKKLVEEELAKNPNDQGLIGKLDAVNAKIEKNKLRLTRRRSLVDKIKKLDEKKKDIEGNLATDPNNEDLKSDFEKIDSQIKQAAYELESLNTMVERINTIGLEHDDNSVDEAFNLILDDQETNMPTQEEQIKDGYSSKMGERDPFQTLGQITRRLLACIPHYVIVDDNGNQYKTPTNQDEWNKLDNDLYEEIEKDDLGFTVYEDPTVAHQRLLQDLIGVRNPQQMLDVLKANPRYKVLYNFLSQDENCGELTTFFNDLSKDFLPYSVIVQTKDWKIKRNVWRMKILNQYEDTISDVLSQLWSGKGWSYLTIFDKDGKIDQNEIDNAITLMEARETSEKNYFDRTQKSSNRYLFMRSLFDMFGIPCSQSVLKVLTNDFSASKQLFKIFFDKKDGLVNILAKKKCSIMYSDKGDSFFNECSESLNRLGKLLNAHNLDTHYAAKIFAMNEKGDIISRYSNVNQSYMGKFFSAIRRYTKNDDAAGLRKYLLERYGGNPIFGLENVVDESAFKTADPAVTNAEKIKELEEKYKNATDPKHKDRYQSEIKTLKSKIKRKVTSTNVWLDEMLKACDDSERSSHKVPLYNNEFLANFMMVRDLGDYDTVWDDFGTRKELIDLITNMNDISPNRKHGFMPVFVLGDSGNAKFICSTKYSYSSFDKKTIPFWVDKFYTIFLQECARMKQANTFRTWALKEHNDSAYIKSFCDDEDKIYKFSYLTFLNEEKDIIQKIKEGETVDKKIIEDLIRKHFKEKDEEFIQKARDVGLFETYEYTYGDEDEKKGISYINFADVEYKEDDSELIDKLEFVRINVEYAMIQQQQLFTIDPSFYPSTKEMQKRYKELHAPGRGLDITAKNPYANLLTQLIQRAPERYNMLQGKFSTIVSEREEENGQKSYGRERCIYFKDIKSKAPEEFKECIRKVFPSDKADALCAAYDKSTLTDGQGYRTLDSYRKVMIMAGGDNWTETHEMAYLEIKRLEYLVREQNYKLTSDDMDLLKKTAIVLNPIKPYLYSFEHVPLNKDGTNSVAIPVQHKYAEAVIIPLLLPEGSMLRDLGFYMQDKGIDLTCSSKCVKVGEWGTVDIDTGRGLKGDKAKQEMYRSLDRAVVHDLSYEDYLIQTNVPDHLTCTRLLGTQIKKLIWNGMNKDKDYSDYVGALPGFTGHIQITDSKNVDCSGRGIMAFYNSLLTANILQKMREFKLSVKDKEALEKILLDDVSGNSRSLIDHYLSFCIQTLENENDYDMDEGHFRVPLNEPGISHEVAVKLISMFKKMVQQQQIFGGAAIQVSEMGITGYEIDNQLKFETDKDGNITYAECEIPFDFQYEDASGNTIMLDYDKYCDEDGYFLDMNNNAIKDPGKHGENMAKARIAIEFPGILERIAYRIPTESNYSMFNLRVVRCSRKIVGGTIRMPAPSTTMAGFDFDIDKLFFITRQFVMNRNGKFISYDFNKEVAQNSTIARNNMILTLMQQRLLDPETLPLRLQPGGFEEASTAARVMRELMYSAYHNVKSLEDAKTEAKKVNGENDKDDPEPQGSSCDPLTWIHYMHQNFIAAKLIGIIANHNTHHVFASQLETFRLKESIAFAGKKLSNLIRYENELDMSDDSVNPQHTVAEFLAASVDAVKDPVLNYLNLNINTINVGLLLARVGYTSEEIGLLLNQPIIREACEYAENMECGITRAINAIAEKYGDKDNFVDRKYNSQSFTKDLLANYIINGEIGRMNTDVQCQLNILKFFSNLNTKALALAKLVNNSKATASNSIGSTFGDIYARFGMFDVAMGALDEKTGIFEIKASKNSDIKMLTNDEAHQTEADLKSLTGKDYRQTISNYLNSNSDNPFMFEQATMDALREFLNITDEYTFYERPMFKTLREMLSNMSSTSHMSAKMINDMHVEFLQSVLSQTDSQFNPIFEAYEINAEDLKKEKPDLYNYLSQLGFFKDKNVKIMTYAEWLEYTLLSELQTYCNAHPEYKEKYAILRYVLQSIKIERIDDGAKYYYLNTKSQSLLDYSRNEIASSWAQMCGDKDSMIRYFAESLYFYFFHLNGFTKNKESFIDCAPTVLKERIKVKMNEREFTYPQFLRAYCQDYADNKDAINLQAKTFIAQFLLHHIDDYPEMIKRLYSHRDDTDTFLEAAVDTNEDTGYKSLKNSVTLSYDPNDPSTYFCITKQGKTKNKIPTYWFYPIISVQFMGKMRYYIAMDMYEPSAKSKNYILIDDDMIEDIQSGKFSYGQTEVDDNSFVFPPSYAARNLRPSMQEATTTSQGSPTERGTISDNTNSVDTDFTYEPSGLQDKYLVQRMILDYVSQISFWVKKSKNRKFQNDLLKIKEKIEDMFKQDSETNAIQIYSQAKALLIPLARNAEYDYAQKMGYKELAQKLKSIKQKVETGSEEFQLLIIDKDGNEKTFC